MTSERRPAIGYAMALGAGTLFALNGTVSKVILKSGLSSLRLTEVRCTGALIGLALILLATRPEASGRTGASSSTSLRSASSASRSSSSSTSSPSTGSRSASRC